MKIKHVRAENFLSYEEFDLEINQGLCLITGYNYDDQTANGSGKTSLIDSICYGIFGLLPRDIKVDQVIHNYSTKVPCVVEITLEDQNREYTITRSRNPNFLKFFIDGVETTGLDSKETQILIEKSLGVTYNIFLNSVYFSQNSKSSFVSANDTEKKEILTELLDLEIFDKSYEYTQASLKSIQAELKQKEFDLTRLQAYLYSAKNEIIQYQSAEEGFEKQKQEKIKEKEQKIQQLLVEVQEISTQINELESKCQPKKSFEDFLKVLNDQDEVIRKARLELDSLNKQKSEVSIKSKILFDKIKSLKSLDSKTCPQCEQSVNSSHVSKLVQDCERTLGDFVPQLENIIQQITVKEEIVKLQSDLDRKKSETRKQLSNIQTFEGQLITTKSLKGSYESQVLSLKDDIEKISTEKSTYSELIRKKQESISKFELEEKEILTEKSKLESQTYKMNVLKDVFKNIKYYIFETVVEEVNDRVNQYIKTLFDTGVQLKFDTHTSNTKGEVKQKFSTTIVKDGIERSYNSLSGGEKKRVELSTNFALSDIISNRSNKTFNVMLLDECFEGLDSAGRERVVHLLELLKTSRENIFIVDHFDSIRSLIDGEIKVEKRDGISSIQYIV